MVSPSMLTCWMVLWALNFCWIQTQKHAKKTFCLRPNPLIYTMLCLEHHTHCWYICKRISLNFDHHQNLIKSPLQLLKIEIVWNWTLVFSFSTLLKPQKKINYAYILKANTRSPHLRLIAHWFSGRSSFFFFCWSKKD